MAHQTFDDGTKLLHDVVSSIQVMLSCFFLQVNVVVDSAAPGEDHVAVISGGAVH